MEPKGYRMPFAPQTFVQLKSLRSEQNDGNEGITNMTNVNEGGSKEELTTTNEK